MMVDWCISNTHHCSPDYGIIGTIGIIGNWWQSVTSLHWCFMNHDDVTYWIHLAMGFIGHPCSTIQGSTRYLFLMTDCWSAEWGICWTRPTTHALLFKLWGGYLSLIKLFFYYLVGPTIIIPGSGVAKGEFWGLKPPHWLFRIFF